MLFRSSATLIAQQIRAKILEQTGLTASAGISVNKFIAKIASDYNKPNGQKTVPPQEILDFLAPLDIKKFYGRRGASMSPASRPWGTSDRMTRALEAFSDLDDALRQLLTGYLVDPTDSPTPTIKDRLALTRAAREALPAVPDAALVLTALSVDM